MSVSPTLARYLEQAKVAYGVIPHPVARSSRRAAEAANVSLDHVVKAVVVSDAEHYAVVLLPASMHVDLRAVREALGRQCGLATAAELKALFSDNERGAVPALAQAYGIEVLVDRRTLELDEVFLESGDGSSLIVLSGKAFISLMSRAERGEFALPGPRAAADH